ncbi:hypothetical protein [Streptococcus zalophi]|uniref:Lipoprotein n=1 Tax=Streptococcus zalophi TaxID=640031 RepID=A0A934P9I3_9STRE|nr:hypothetical protein [Streptococcus zalophi]MBJ8349453.1 hypothetical protein [Streptococcus zalophi]
MKKIFLAIIVTVGIVGLFGCSNNKESDIIDEVLSKKEENISEKITKKALKLTQKAGDERVGYYNIPEDFVTFTDINNPDGDDVQYSDVTGKYIITLNTIDISNLTKEEKEAFTAETAADNIAGYLKEDKDLETLELYHYDDFQDKVYQNVATYKTGEVLSVNLFEHDGTIYFFGIEGSEDFVNTYWVNILDSFSTTK